MYGWPPSSSTRCLYDFGMDGCCSLRNVNGKVRIYVFRIIMRLITYIDEFIIWFDKFSVPASHEFFNKLSLHRGRALGIALSIWISFSYFNIYLEFSFLFSICTFIAPFFLNFYFPFVFWLLGLFSIMTFISLFYLGLNFPLLSSIAWVLR